MALNDHCLPGIRLMSAIPPVVGSQNHRLAEVRRDLWRPSGPIPMLKMLILKQDLMATETKILLLTLAPKPTPGMYCEWHPPLPMLAGLRCLSPLAGGSQPLVSHWFLMVALHESGLGVSLEITSFLSLEVAEPILCPMPCQRKLLNT